MDGPSPTPPVQLRFKLGNSEEEMEQKKRLAWILKQKQMKVKEKLGAGWVDKRGSKKRLESREKKEEKVANGNPKDNFLKLLQRLYGEDKVNIKYIKKRPEYFDKFKALELETGAPLNPSSEEFKGLATRWIFGPGIHVLVDIDDGDIISVVRVQVFTGMGIEKQRNMIKSLETIMNWMLAMAEINNNKAHGKKECHVW
ncbi:hypothetical protein HYPSUDRAFT_207004 [Hypholoma sublateritium FD-334 SS-4]|uniref:Uncharacterized protein n=1 Tax=Hypholoma sublateritium (strain FD-334 SS-4) TaxID=945553 RepID=A0A0D2P836_HYPSF|nr:hypothetical protein HYPSUDRAFT_207004 [Hypholoma sublateritium FD-334 SS-4]